MCDVIVTAAAEPLEHFMARGGDEIVEGGVGEVGITGNSAYSRQFRSSTACENKLIMTAGCGPPQAVVVVGIG